AASATTSGSPRGRAAPTWPGPRTSANWSSRRTGRDTGPPRSGGRATASPSERGPVSRAPEAPARSLPGWCPLRARALVQLTPETRPDGVAVALVDLVVLVGEQPEAGRVA